MVNLLSLLLMLQLMLWCGCMVARKRNEVSLHCPGMRVITLHCRQVTSRDLMTSQHGRRRDDVNQQVAAVLTATGRTAAVTCRITLPSAGYSLNLQWAPPLKIYCPFSWEYLRIRLMDVSSVYWVPRVHLDWLIRISHSSHSQS